MSSPPPDNGEHSAAGAFRAMLTGLPRHVWLLALAAAAFHMLPVWMAAWNAPEDWLFTGNLTLSPDYMQYRLWMRQVLEEGWIVSNRLTVEPTGRFLPVALYWFLGHLAALGGWAPEFVYQYAGAGLAAFLAVLIYALLRRFLPRGPTFWVAYGVLMLGGGLGGYLKLAERVPFFSSFRTFNTLILEPTRLVPIMEDYRQHYLVTVLVDTHFLLVWLLAVLSIMLLLAGRRRAGWGWTVLTAVVWSATAVVHVYTGLTVAVIGLAILAVSRLDGRQVDGEVRRTAVPCLGVALVLVWLLRLQGASGFPMPDWREPLVLPTTLLLGFPLQLALLGWWGSRLWRDRDDDVVVLMGWLVGCLLLTLGGPFYPYPSRGLMTMVLPLTLLAALAWLRSGRRLSALALAVVVLATGSTTAWRLDLFRLNATFRTQAPWAFLGPEHREILEGLERVGNEDSVLLAPETDILWLMPRFDGRPWVAHFFLSRDYEARAARARRFFAGEETERWLAEEPVDLLFIPADAPVGATLGERTDLEVVVANGVGVLLHRPGAGEP